MAKDSKSPLAILAVALAAVVTVTTTSGFYSALECIIGLVLIGVLFRYGYTRTSSIIDNLLFAALFGFLALLSIGFITDAIYILKGWFFADQISIPFFHDTIFKKNSSLLVFIKRQQVSEILPMFTRRTIMYVIVWFGFSMPAFIIKQLYHKPNKMNKCYRTESGRYITDGIEYNEYPPPQKLVKAMKWERAQQLLNNGLARLHKLEYYRNWENELLGDRNDGEGLYHLDGHRMETGSINDVYALCFSLSVIEESRLLLLAQHGDYDCIVVIHSPEELFKRVQNWLSEHTKGFTLHCGLVNYNRGEEVDKKTLNSQKFHFNVFQKALRFKDDKEYRMAITNSTFSRLPKNYLDLLLGDCSDIISIEALPNKSLEPTS